MVEFLRANGFLVFAITKCDVSKDQDAIDYHIFSDHVVLVSSLVAKSETTWQVIYDGFIFHNFEIDKMSPLEFLNNPPRTAYVLWKPEWASK